MELYTPYLFIMVDGDTYTGYVGQDVSTGEYYNAAVAVLLHKEYTKEWKYESVITTMQDVLD